MTVLEEASPLGEGRFLPLMCLCALSSPPLWSAGPLRGPHGLGHVLCLQTVAFVFLFGFSHHLENSTLRLNGPSGKSHSGWENVKSLRLPEGTRGEGQRIC